LLVVVTGATGLLGNNIVRLLLEQGHRPRVLVRDTRIGKPLAGLDVEALPGDVREPETLKTGFAGADLVIHCAAQVHIGWTKADLLQQVNVEGTKAVAEAAMNEGARLVHVSSVDALGVGSEDEPADETSPREGKFEYPYVKTKREAEDAVRHFFDTGLKGVIVNPGLMFGPWDWKPSSGQMILSYIQRRPLMAPRGGCSACDVRDVAFGVLAAAAKGKQGENYILAGENMRFIELWKIFAEVAETKPPWQQMGPVVSNVVGRIGDVWSQMEGREVEFNSAAIKASSQFHYYKSDKAKAELGYQHRPAREAIEIAYRWFKKYGYLKKTKKKKK